MCSEQTVALPPILASHADPAQCWAWSSSLGVCTPFLVNCARKFESSVLIRWSPASAQSMASRPTAVIAIALLSTVFASAAGIGHDQARCDPAKLDAQRRGSVLSSPCYPPSAPCPRVSTSRPSHPHTSCYKEGPLPASWTDTCRPNVWSCACPRTSATPKG